MIEFRTINQDNYSACLALNPGEANKDFVAPNVNSLAIAYVNKENNVCKPMPFAIYKDDIMIGFIMMSFMGKDQDNDMDEDTYDIWRFMIDEKYQGKGYGRASLVKAVEFIKTFPYGPAKKLVLSYAKENKAGSSLYRSVGFIEVGEQYEGEIDMELDLMS